MIHSVLRKAPDPLSAFCPTLHPPARIVRRRPLQRPPSVSLSLSRAADEQQAAEAAAADRRNKRRRDGVDLARELARRRDHDRADLRWRAWEMCACVMVCRGWRPFGQRASAARCGRWRWRRLAKRQRRRRRQSARCRRRLPPSMPTDICLRHGSLGPALAAPSHPSISMDISAQPGAS